MKESYFRKEGVWLKGNLHSHSTVSDGDYFPQALIDIYADHGYDFVSITDHNIYMSHEGLNTRGLILLTGVEHDLLQEFGVKCVHIVGTGRPDHPETGYVCKKYSIEELSSQGLINMMARDNQFVVIAHPVWSRMEPEEIAGLKGYHAIEVYNNGCENLCHAGHAEIYWDYLLRRGIKVFATACDDTHHPQDACGGWIWVKAKKKTYPAIFEALFEGQFYASNGPVITDFGADNNEVYVFCSECREIHFVTYPVRGKSFFAKTDLPLTTATYTRKGNEKYIRVECIDYTGHTAWTNPIYFDK